MVEFRMVHHSDPINVNTGTFDYVAGYTHSYFLQTRVPGELWKTVPFVESSDLSAEEKKEIVDVYHSAVQSG